MLGRWADVVARRARAVVVAGVLLTLAAAVYGMGVFDSLDRGGFDDKDSETARELALEREVFGNQTVNVVAIYGSDEMTADDPRFQTAVEDIVAGIPDDAVATVVPYYAAPPELAPELVSGDGHYAQVLISMAGDSENEYLRNYDDVRPALDAPATSGLTTDIAGGFAVYDDVNKETSNDLKRAELISFPIVVLLALLIFGSLVAASMPALVGLIAMLGALAVVRVIASFTDVSIFAVNIVSLIGIGLAIDYALFVISRFREELALLPADHPDAADIAIRRTLATAGRTVLFSGLTVAAAMSSLLIFPQAFLRSMGYGGVAAVVIAMLAALTILPAVLRMLGRRVDAGRLPWRRHRAVAVEDPHGRWGRLAHAVMRRPFLVIAVTVGGLLLVAAPFLGVKWGSVDYRVLPSHAPAHQAAVLLNEEFGAEQSTASIMLSGADAADRAAYQAAVAEVPGIVGVTEVATDTEHVLLRAAWNGNSQTERSQDIVRSIRDVAPPSGEALVGGLTADTVDLASSIGAHLPLMGLIVIGVMLVLLFIAFGSLVLPIKAVLMNTLSITAAFGVVTWIFSDGHLSDLLGFSPQGFLDLTNPIVMLAILFGLSMDYEVFLLSRVREQWDRSAGDPELVADPARRNAVAVATGVQKTGRIITSAALLLGVVIGAFGMSGIVFMKMLGIGMLVALLVDATIVRALLVPATMKLLGAWNWWAPGPLRRWWERYGFREEAPEPPRDREPAVVA
ncbi:MMPL family transporter [Nocardioides sp. R-C-SC26]|uniref:MMPL family transporter n=1 Tax=Nocardioides sp. R-C-SC26 TaxID=2870414 RepID=UPI001E58AC64|nr:MMPL family transporter [Nocardioides sp. R-C-SC26]